MRVDLTADGSKKSPETLLDYNNLRAPGLPERNIEISNTALYLKTRLDDYWWTAETNKNLLHLVVCQTG